MRLLFPFLALTAALLHSPAESRSAAPADGADRAGKSAQGFDTAQVRKLYQDGDFEPAIAILESAVREHRIPGHRDSVFVYKHLGVMHAANEGTRERGKYFMLQLLTIEPTARIMDMYASDMIYMIFRNIQEEFSLSHGGTERPMRPMKPVMPVETEKEPAGVPEPQRSGKGHAESGHGKAYLLAGAAAVAVGVGVTLFVLNEADPVATRNHEVKR